MRRLEDCSGDIYDSQTLPRRVGETLVFARSLVLNPLIAQRIWEEQSSKVDLEVREKAPIIVIAPREQEVCYAFSKRYSREAFNGNPLVITSDIPFPDGEYKTIVNINMEKPPKSVYLIGSVLIPDDLVRICRVADHLKGTLGVKSITLVAPFLSSTRQDKNVNPRTGEYVPETLNVRADLKVLGSFVNRLIVIEPHSFATQAFAVQAGIPTLLMSPWKYELDCVLKESGISPKDIVIARPDAGRIVVATRMEQELGVKGISFEKTRIGSGRVVMNDLTMDEAELIKDKIVFCFDDEISSMGTIFSLAEACERYKAQGLIILVVHGKFTLEWKERLAYPIIKAVYVTDSRPPVCKYEDLIASGKIHIIPLSPFLSDILKADIAGVDFYKSKSWEKHILQ